MVAIHFIVKPPDYTDEYVVDHINEIKTDNHVKNLRWLTQSENLFAHHENKRKRAILQYDKNNVFIKKWNNCHFSFFS